ncbi:integrase core domain-containing protein [Sphingobacterium sp. SG20118]|uniref:integrase core domain-containing protein n=1 Tax=Sphingobacterium sp. SG20118 TaxID=3367156 RepID=UPI0037DFC2F1
MLKHQFVSFENTKQIIEGWRHEYNTFRPHSCLENLTSEIFIENQVKIAKLSTFEYFQFLEWR